MAATGSTPISASAKEPLRLIGWYGPNNHRKDKAGVPGEKDTDEGAIDVTEGGTAIPYWRRIRSCARNTKRRWRKGVKCRWAHEIYRPRPVIAMPPRVNTRRDGERMTKRQLRLFPAGGNRGRLLTALRAGSALSRGQRIGARASSAAHAEDAKPSMPARHDHSRGPSARRRGRCLWAAGAADLPAAFRARPRSWCRTCRAPALKSVVYLDITRPPTVP